MGDVVMPRLSDSMEEGTVLKWLKADGESVSRGDELVEIETDKATMTYEADQDGVLEIVAAEGETLPIGDLIARLSANGATAPAQATDAAPAPPPAEAQAPTAPVVPIAPEPTAAEISEGQHVDAPTPPVVRPQAPGVVSPTASDGGPRLKASPVARRIAREGGVDLGTLSGSGPGGRIVRADVEAALAGGVSTPDVAPRAPLPVAPGPPEAAPSTQPGTAKGAVTIRELTRAQQVVARRMAESKATVPHFTLETEIEMQRCVELRAQVRELADVVPSYNDMVVRASALALREFPRANGSYRDGRWELYARVNVGIAVAAEDGLVVPTVFDADRKSLLTIAVESRTLAERVRSGAITPPELSGGTFTVSNLGMYGVTNFAAVINPPQAAIFAVGAMRERALPAGVTNVMAVTLSCDHRILYGADAAQFLGRIRERLENPLSLAL